MARGIWRCLWRPAVRGRSTARRRADARTAARCSSLLSGDMPNNELNNSPIAPAQRSIARSGSVASSLIAAILSISRSRGSAIRLGFSTMAATSASAAEFGAGGRFAHGRELGRAGCGFAEVALTFAMVLVANSSKCAICRSSSAFSTASFGAELMHHAALAESALARDRIERQPARPSRAMIAMAASSAALRDRSERAGIVHEPTCLRDKTMN